MENYSRVIIFEEWAGFLKYSERLAKAFYSMTKNFLEDADYLNIDLQNSLSDKRILNGMSVAHLEIECLKHDELFFR